MLTALLLEDATSDVVGMVQEYGRDQIKNGSLKDTLFGEEGDARAEVARSCSARALRCLRVRRAAMSPLDDMRDPRDDRRYSQDGASPRAFPTPRPLEPSRGDAASIDVGTTPIDADMTPIDIEENLDPREATSIVARPPRGRWAAVVGLVLVVVITGLVLLVAFKRTTVKPTSPGMPSLPSGETGPPPLPAREIPEIQPRGPASEPGDR